MARGSQRSGVLDVIALLAILAAIAGPLLAWLRLVPALVGFYVMALGGLLSLLLAIGTVIGLVRGRRYGVARMLGLLVALVFVIVAVRGAGGAPPINDFTTDLDDPPAFRKAAMLPPNVGRDMSYPAAFAETQRACCADLRPLELAEPPAEALLRAVHVAARMPRWTVTQVDTEAGTIEAVEETRIFGFRDDIVIRVRPDGAGSIVDMRSKSRDGRSDLGANAARIRAFLAALQQSKASSQ
ncbi:MAG TPA: DUF1499 domain-containing protein [Candidatus Binatia bacterium]